MTAVCTSCACSGIVLPTQCLSLTETYSCFRIHTNVLEMRLPRTFPVQGIEVWSSFWRSSNAFSKRRSLQERLSAQSSSVADRAGKQGSVRGFRRLVFANAERPNDYGARRARASVCSFDSTRTGPLGTRCRRGATCSSTHAITRAMATIGISKRRASTSRARGHIGGT